MNTFHSVHGIYHFKRGKNRPNLNASKQCFHFFFGYYYESNYSAGMNMSPRFWMHTKISSVELCYEDIISITTFYIHPDSFFHFPSSFFLLNLFYDWRSRKMTIFFSVGFSLSLSVNFISFCFLLLFAFSSLLAYSFILCFPHTFDSCYGYPYLQLLVGYAASISFTFWWI